MGCRSIFATRALGGGSFQKEDLYQKGVWARFFLWELHWCFKAKRPFACRVSVIFVEDVIVESQQFWTTYLLAVTYQVLLDFFPIDIYLPWHLFLVRSLFLGHLSFDTLSYVTFFACHLSGGENPDIILFYSCMSSALLPQPQFELPRMIGKLILLPQNFRTRSS